MHASSDNMKDEYGAMDKNVSVFEAGDLTLESGEILKSAQISYKTFGQLNAARDNVMVVCHALTVSLRRLDRAQLCMLASGGSNHFHYI